MMNGLLWDIPWVDEKLQIMLRNILTGSARSFCLHPILQSQLMMAFCFIPFMEAMMNALIVTIMKSVKLTGRQTRRKSLLRVEIILNLEIMADRVWTVSLKFLQTSSRALLLNVL